MRLKKEISNWGLLMTSLGAMIGSGWLFGALYAAQIAGPASVFSWIFGGLLLIVVGLNYAELSTALPLAGGISRYTHITHGSMVSFSTTWLAWLSCVSAAPTEAQAILQYASHYIPWPIYTVAGNEIMTTYGWMTAIALVLLFCFINMYAIRFVTRFNAMMTYWKILIPIVVIVCIMYEKFDVSNFTNYGGMTPFGAKNVLWAIPSAGIIFSFLGFRECISMAGETKKPSQAIPFALIGSVVICTLLYAAIQIIFVGSLSPDMLANGWGHISLSLNHTGPLAAIAIALGMSWLVKLIYIDAIVSPAGTGIIYTATTARLNYGASANKYLPEFMMKTTRHGVPLNAIIVNFVIGILLLAPLPSWQALVAFQSTSIVISYGLGPICLMVLRQKVPELKRPFVLPKSKLISLITFYICSLIAYWTGWTTIRQTGFAIMVGLIFMLAYRLYSKRGRSHPIDFKHFYWFIFYTIGLTTISWLGAFGDGKNIIPFGIDFLVIGLFSVIVFIMGLHSAHSEDQIRNRIYTDPEYIEHEQLQKKE